MPSSPALQNWLGQRALELDELFHAHGTLVGSPYAGLQVEQACIIAVSGQFQGYCRDVLRLAVTLIVDAAAPPAAAAPAAPPPAAGAWVAGAPTAAPAAPAAVSPLRTALQAGFSADLQLNKANPTWGTLVADFARIGMDLAGEVGLIIPRPQLLDLFKGLARLNTWRNAIAHQHFEYKADVLRDTLGGKRQPSVADARQCRAECDALARGVDQATEAYLRGVLGRNPW